MVTTYLDAILEDGIKNPNFFNGRILTAQDLRDEQTAHRERSRRLGKAIGDGIAYGLKVSESGARIDGQRVLEITAGLAVNRCGDTLFLGDDITLPLTADFPLTEGRFPFGAPCDPPASVSELVPNGYMLLAITAAVGLSDERAPHSGLNTVTNDCIARYEIEGVQFKLISLTGYFEASPNLPPGSVQSQLAYACFGADITTQAAGAATFTQPTYYGLIDELREAGDLTDCDVPLAVLALNTGESPDFVDMWAVRRPCSGLLSAELYAPQQFANEPYPFQSTPRRRVESFAMFMQFQAQFEALANVSGVTVMNTFVYLPSAGYIRQMPAQTPSMTRARSFFTAPNLTVTPIDPAFVRRLFDESFSIDPIPVVAGQALPIRFYTLDIDNMNYLIFARREIIAENVPPVVDERPTNTTGRLVITVTDEKGQTLTQSAVKSVDAAKSGIKGGGGGLTFERKPSYFEKYAQNIAVYGVPNYTSVTGTFSYTEKRAMTQIIEDAYHFLPGSAKAEGVTKLTDKLPAVYTETLTPGHYTVSVTPASTAYGIASTTATVSASQTTHVTVQLKRKRVVAPGKNRFELEEDWILGNGYIVDKVVTNPKWRYPVDPPPDEWLIDPPEKIREQIEDLVGEWVVQDPAIANVGAQFYVNPAYDPSQPQDAPYAFLGTADGGYYPLVMVASEYSLAGDVPAARGGLTDLETPALREAGFDYLDVLAAAPAALVAETLGTSAPLVKSAVIEAQTAARSMQTGFTRYAGIDKGASDRLGSAFSNDVALANATPESVKAALGEGFSAGFAARLIEKARASVPRGSWALDTLKLNDSQRGALENAGVRSLGDLVATGKGNQRGALVKTLKISSEAFDGLLTDASTGLAAGTIKVASKGSIAALEGVTGDRAARLIEAGFTSTRDIAAAKPDQIAAATGAPLSDAAVMIDSARARTGGTLEISTLKDALNLDTATANKLTKAGITTVVDLSKADASTLSTIVKDPAAVNTLTSNANLILNKTASFRRF